MLKWQQITSFPGIIIGLVFFSSLFVFQIVVAEVDAPTLQYIAKNLLPNECENIINHEIPEPINVISPVAKSYEPSSNEINCFRNLVAWVSNFRIFRRDAHIILGNRLRQIGRNDLAAVLIGPSSRGRPITEETIEYESWDSKKDRNRVFMSSSDSTIPKIGSSIYKSPQIKSIAGLAPELRQQSIPPFPDLRRLNGIHSLDSFKDRYSVKAEPGSEHLATSAPGYVPVEPTGQHQERGNDTGSNTTLKGNDGKSPEIVSGKPPEAKKQDKSKLSGILPGLTDEKSTSCLRVPLGTAMIVIGTIMVLTCCCALLLRNRLVACFERFRGKKTKTGKRMSMDEEQGFMGPRTFGKPPKRSGRKGGGPPDVANVGVQNANVASNASVESEEKPTGCCSCTRKKKKSRRKWKK